MTQRMSVLSALKELGYDLRKPCSGSVMVQVDVCKYKHYAFRHRNGDGRVHCRLGRLISAYRQPGSNLMIFEVDGYTF